MTAFLKNHNDALGSATAAIHEFIVKSLVPNEEMWLRCYRLKIRAFDEKTTSICEGQNASAKRGPMPVKPNMSIKTSAEVMTVYSTAKNEMRAMESAKQLEETQLWSRSQTCGELTDYAEGLSSQNFDRRCHYCSVKGEF
ncbi:MAG: hypothetical protein ACREOZ_04895 [Gloeomargaritales cyanobacterium]